MAPQTESRNGHNISISRAMLVFVKTIGDLARLAQR
jgi:hypothetical protein